jgi:asparagine synthase (glutamine-hydrolysing)
MVDHHGGPFSDAANIPLYLMSAEVRDTTKVILQGDGGDEMFGGYSRYTTLSHLRTARAAGAVVGVLDKFGRRSAARYRRARYTHALAARDSGEMMALLLTEEDPHSHPEMVFGPEFRRQVSAFDPFVRYRELQPVFMGDDPVNQMLSIDAMVILPDIFLEKVDRSTMAAGVEVRVPFLDNDLVEFCLGLTGSEKVRGGRKKWLLKKALEGIVPDEVLYGKKTGFGVPYGYWLRTALHAMFDDNLQVMNRRHPGVLDPVAVRRLMDEHVSRRRDWSFLLWKLFNFMLWANRSNVTFSP